MGRARGIAAGLLVVGGAALVIAVLASGPTYTLNAHFLSAGRVVPGGQVEVAGRAVGTVSHIGLTPDGEADLMLSIDDASVVPLHVGTRAAIRALSQGSVDGNVVVLTPGPSAAPVLRSGAALSTLQTSSTIDIDALLDSFGPAQRASLRALIGESANIYAGSGSRYFNGLLGELDPALGALAGTTSSLSADSAALGEFVQTAAEAASVVASRRTDLSAAVLHTASALGAVARQHVPLADLLSRLPSVLTQARGTLANAATAVVALRPTLRDVPPVARPLRVFLPQADATLENGGPAVAKLRGALPSVNQALAGLAPIQRPAVQTLQTLGPVMKGLFPISEGLRFYAADLIIGSLAGIFGTISPEYDAYGHYAKLNFVQPVQSLVGGPLSTALAAHPLLPGLFAERTGVTRRCPGGAEPPAPDGSSPWVLGAAWCTASEDTPLSVDFP